jgi:uncharacterized membrane protein/mono/diheme cytochrome c family protein
VSRPALSFVSSSSRVAAARSALGVLVSAFAAAPALADEGAVPVPVPVPVPVALLGRLHFPLLHFPIALLFAVVVVELFGGARLEPAARKHVSSTLLSVSAVFAVITAISGLAYAQGEDFGGAEATTFALHRALGLVTAAVVVVLAALRRSPDTSGAARAFRPLLVAGAVAVSATGHFGGELVHGDGFLTRPLRGPDAKQHEDKGRDDDKHDGDDQKSDDDDGPRAASDGDEGHAAAEVRQRYAEGPIPEKPAYEKDIRPLFQRSCVKCHGPEKRKSGLRLDEKRFAMKGGENGPAIVPGDVTKSGVFTSCSAPPDDEDVMPPKGKLLALSEIETLKRWIEQGAVWPDDAAK